MKDFTETNKQGLEDDFDQMEIITDVNIEELDQWIKSIVKHHPKVLTVSAVAEIQKELDLSNKEEAVEHIFYSLLLLELTEIDTPSLFSAIKLMATNLEKLGTN